MQANRDVINSDQLLDMTHLSPHYEFSCNKCNLHAFTVSGTLNGQPVIGAFFAAECMVIESKSTKVAKAIAAEGLKTTRDLLFEEGFTRELRAAQDADISRALSIDTSRPSTTVTDHKLASMLSDSLSRKAKLVH